MFFEKIINLLDFYHQKRIINFLKKYDISYFIDVGSHKGEFLSYLLNLKHKKIYCFEPQKKIFKILYKNFKNNKKIKFFNIGLSNKNSTRKFYLNKLTSTSTFSRSKNTFFFRLKNFILNSENNFPENCFIKTKKLDQIKIDNEMSDIFLKIDVEGFELMVLKGAKKLLYKKVKFVLVEKHFFQLFEKKTTEKVHLFLKKNNFKLLKRFTYPSFHFQDNLYIKINKV